MASQNAIATLSAYTFLSSWGRDSACSVRVCVCVCGGEGYAYKKYCTAHVGKNNTATLGTVLMSGCIIVRSRGLDSLGLVTGDSEVAR